MSDFTDLIARAVSPSMTRAERDHVYGVIRQAVVRLQEREALSPGEPRVALQRHLVEETIRDVEADIARFLALEQMEKAAAAQAAETTGSR